MRILITITLMFFCKMGLSQVKELPPLTIGQNLSFHSTVLDEDRVITISLPRSYDTNASKFPVVYVLDGEYRFNPTFGIYSYMTYWEGVPEAILVGISNVSRQSRERDYLPKVYGGDADNFIEFLRTELIPYINDNYKTSTQNHIVGHSHGGVFSFYVFLKAPELFEGYISSDPSLMGL